MELSEEEGVHREEEDEEEVAESFIGTKEYWDECYKTELANFRDHGDTGDVWFGESSIRRIVSWVTCPKNGIHKNDSILDVGCGNGMTLVHLAKEGFSNLWGVDYVPEAVALAQEICARNDVQDVIQIQVGDVLKDEQLLDAASCLKQKYKLVIDKGTFDAISQCPDNPNVQRQRYIDCICKLVISNGFFLITSCNWTEDELLKHFQKGFVMCDQIPAPTFQFGGKSGSQITTVIFRRTD